MAVRVSSEQRRRDLIAVALGQYVAQGLDATTRTSLAGELGVDRVIVHRLYPDLDDLFADVVDHVRTVGFTEIARVAATVDELPSTDELWAVLLRHVVRAARSHPLEWAFLFLAPPDPDAARQLEQLRAALGELVIGELVARADPPSTDEERQELAWGARFLYEGLFGALAAHLATGDEADDDRFVASIAGILDDLVELPESLSGQPTG